METNQFYKWEYIEKALKDLVDIQERATINFILLGNAAKAIKTQVPDVMDRIDIVMKRSQLVPEVKSNFKTWQFKPESWGYSWTYSPDTLWHIKIPVNLYLYNKYILFDNPAREFAFTESFLVPNPFNEYWERRYIILNKLKKQTQ